MSSFRVSNAPNAALLITCVVSLLLIAYLDIRMHWILWIVLGILLTVCALLALVSWLVHSSAKDAEHRPLDLADLRAKTAEREARAACDKAKAQYYESRAEYYDRRSRD